MVLIVLEMWYKIQRLSWNSVLVSCLQKTAILGRASPGMRWLPPSPCLKSRLHSVTETWHGAESRGRNPRRWQRNSFSSQIHFLLNLTPIPLCPAPMSSSPMPTIAERTCSHNTQAFTLCARLISDPCPHDAAQTTFIVFTVPSVSATITYFFFTLHSIPLPECAHAHKTLNSILLIWVRIRADR